MSEQAVEGAPSGTEGESAEEIILPAHGDLAFSALMDALAPEKDAGAQARGEDGRYLAEGGGAAAGAAPATGGDAATAGAAGAGAAGATAAGAQQPADPAPAGAGDAGGDQAGGDAQRGAGALPDAWTASSAEYIPRLSELTTKFEERTTQAYQQQAFEAVREEHTSYFEALNKHPRALVGSKVPSVNGTGDETLQSTADATEWQEAVKHLLMEEVRDRAGRELESNRGFMDTVHQSIELFQNNPDLIPGTKDFDVELANRFTTLAEPYELRVEGKLQGYSVPVQGLIDKIRDDITKQRAAAPQTPASAPATPPSTSPGAGAGDRPQAGIASKAGSGSSSEDFGPLFGTLGLPDFRI